MVIKVTNLGDDLREAFNNGCQGMVFVFKVIKMTNWEDMMNFGNKLRGV